MSFLRARRSRTTSDFAFDMEYSMPSEELDRKLSEVSSRVISAWIKEENRMADDGESLFKPLITWPPGTEYLHKVTLPEEDSIEDKLAAGIHEVFSRYGLQVWDELVDDLIESVLKGKAGPS